MTHKGLLRLQKREAGIPQPPMKYCHRCDLPETKYLFEPRQSTLAFRLKQLDPGFEIIYDRATTKNNMQPGHHLYRVIRKGASQAMDYMVLELSIQEDLDMRWPTGVPKLPGDWLIAELQSRRKSRFEGSEASVQKQLEEMREAGNIANEAKIQRETNEAISHFDKETQPYLKGQKSFTGPKNAKRRRFNKQPVGSSITPR